MTYPEFLKKINEIGVKKGALEEACGFAKGKITKLEFGQMRVKEVTIQDTLKGLELIINQLTTLLEEATSLMPEIPEGQYIVYEFTFPNSKKYYGYALDAQTRWQNGHGYKGQKVGEAIEEFGWENVEKKIIAKNLTKDNAKMLEKSLIKATNSDISLLGYNIY